MAFFAYKCQEHGKFNVSLPKRLKKQKCPVCEVDCSAIINIGSSSVMERLDNGAMSRAVERLHNIEEIMNERADKHTKDFEESHGIKEEDSE